MTSKSELKRRATQDPIGTAFKYHDLEKERDLLLEVLSNLVDDCDIWKLSITEVVSSDDINWQAFDVAKELVTNLKKKKK